MSTNARPLFRALLREARQMNDYNFRSYAIRRVKIGFAANANLPEGGDDAIAAIRGGEEQLAVLRRQALIGNLYPSGSSVMDSP